MIKIASVLGARPQFVKAATLSRAITKNNRGSNAKSRIKEVVIHTGQHYDENMSKLFFDELEVPQPDYNLGIGSDSHGIQTGKMMVAIEAVLMEEKPDIVITYGDTNSTIAGALAAVKLQILSAHVEAGLRSYNRRMPEEINRLVTDRISNILFCPTVTAVENLRKEGIESDPRSEGSILDFNHRLVLNTGDVVLDSILFNKELARKRSDILSRMGLTSEKYCLATVHRSENTDDPKRLSNIFDALEDIASKGLEVLIPLHPRTKRRLEETGLRARLGLIDSDLDLIGADHVGLVSKKGQKKGIAILKPLSYLDRLQLERHAYVIFTDSGGVQKEAFTLRIPCITLRDETEWLETVACGWNILTGANPVRITDAFLRLSAWEGQGPPFKREISTCGWNFNGTQMSPYGDGSAAEKIVEVLSNSLTGGYKENAPPMSK